jgi:SAM-dependent methyltransferase
MQTKSFLRREEYKALSELIIDGAILDVGGSKKSGYHELIKGDHTFMVGNIDEAYGIDVVFNAEQAWPFEKETFSAVLFINLLEHLYGYREAVREAHRVLVPSGRLVGVVPFMLNVHGTPSDHFRYTRFTIDRLLKEEGFDEIDIRELGTGAFSVIYHCLIGFVRWNWMASLLIPLFGAMDRFIGVVKPGNKMSAAYMPLGYYFTARKPGLMRQGSI